MSNDTRNRPAARRNSGGRVPPHNLQAEESLLGALLVSFDAQEQTVDTLTADDFYKPHHQYVFDAIRGLWAVGSGKVDIVTVSDELRRAGLLDDMGGVEFLQSLLASTPALSNAPRYAKIVRDTAQRRAIIKAAGETIESAYEENDDIGTIVNEAKTKLDTVELMGGTTVDAVRGRDFMDMPPAAYSWVVPYIIEDDDRLLLTGGEGSGKSLILLQWSIMTACGTHWWTLDPVPAKRCLFVDMELGLKRTRRRAELFAEEADYSCDAWRDNIVIRSKPGDVDVTTRSGASWLASLVEKAEPDLLIIGPIYRLTSGVTQPGDIGGEDQAKRAAFALDKIRERYGCALVSETHAAKGEASRGRDMRPFGSSVWTRWPEFGYSIVKQAGDKQGYHPDNRDWTHWRGDRDPREWPSYFTQHDEGWRMRAQFEAIPSYWSKLQKGTF